MSKRVFRFAVLVSVLTMLSSMLAPRRAHAIFFCLEQCVNHQLQLCCGDADFHNHTITCRSESVSC